MGNNNSHYWLKNLSPVRRSTSSSEMGRPTVALGLFSCQCAQLFPVAGSYTSLKRCDGTATP